MCSFFIMFSIFLFSIIVVISSFIECMPVKSPFSPPFPRILCGVGGVGGVAGCGGGGGERESVCVSE